MKSSAHLFLTGSLLALCAASSLPGQQSTLTSPAPRDSGLPPSSTKEVAPAPGLLLPELKLVAQFDKDGDQRLDAGERKAARAFLAQHPPPDSVPTSGRPGPIPPPAVALDPVKPGAKVSPAGAAIFPGQPLYDPRILRTLFLDFEDTDWEKELADFARTDVLVPARLTVDGQILPGVGVRFRREGASLPATEGYKRSLDLTLGQAVAGQRQIRLLAATTDPTFLRAMLYYRVAREYLPTPKASFVRVVINGEDWGVYTSVQPLDENFLKENFGPTHGARWTVGPGGNLAYLGDNPDAYRGSYRLESPEDPAAWAALIRLCKTLNQPLTGEHEDILGSLLDIDEALKFLAVENALINQDGYGSHTGTFGLCLDRRGRFHLVPQDAEDSFRLVQVSEYDKHPAGGARRSSGGRADAPKVDGKAPDPAKPAAPGYTRNNFPKQSGTNLAMLLSYSFINKADTDLDEKVTKDEWLAFARIWFTVMDEDRTGRLTHEQFISKVRLLVTPASIADGHTRQTFGHEDAAAVIGQDLFNAMDENHDGQLTPDEMTNTFARWFTAWANPKSARLTQDTLEKGLTELLTQSVFEADQTYIATKQGPRPEAEERSGGGGRGGRRGGGGGNGVSVGPLRLGLGGRNGQGADTRTLVIFSEQLDPLDGLGEDTKPLIAKLLVTPALRTRYLEDLRNISENWLSWNQLGPIAKEYHDLIAAEVAKETHKPASYEHFVQELDQDISGDQDAAQSLKSFITQRRSYLQKDGNLIP